MSARLAGLGLAFLLNAPAALADFKVPAMTGPVNDDAGMLSPATKSALDAFLGALWKQGGSQIAVLTVKDLGGIPIEEASIKVTNAWKLGTAKGDNGVLLLVSKDDRALRIEVGQGLEGVLPDAYSKRLIDNVIVPQMRAGDPSRAILLGVNGILGYTDPKAGLVPDPNGNAGQANNNHDDYGGRSGFGGLPLGLKALVALIVLLWVLFGGGGGYRRRRGIFWTGGGGGFGSGGGGWSGGGGGFSGGGASGKW